MDFLTCQVCGVIVKKSSFDAHKQSRRHNVNQQRMGQHLTDVFFLMEIIDELEQQVSDLQLKLNIEAENKFTM